MSGLVRYCIRKPVPVNLLMIAIILAGLFAASSLRREFFPEVDAEQAIISLPYPGASPEEIEDALAIKVEDQLYDLERYVDQINTTLAEGGGGITVDFLDGTDPDEALDEIERAIDQLQDLPDDAEEITVKLLEPRLPVIRVALFGGLDEAVSKAAIRKVRDDLRSLPGMGEVLIDGARDYEISVEVNREALARYGLSLPDVAGQINAAMRDIPGGTVRGDAANIKVRTMGVPEQSAAIRDIEVLADRQGRAVRVSDIATVRDSFVDDEIINRFNGEPAGFLTVFKVGDQDIVEMANMVRAYVAASNGEPFEPTLRERAYLLLPQSMRGMAPPKRLTAYRLGADATNPLPTGAKIAAFSDLARYVEGRLELLTRNALYGAALVFTSLLVFLNWRVAMWVGVGLVTAILGTLVFMQFYDITLNLLTMFGLIVVLGLLVDDAIVVSENIQRRHDHGEPAMRAAERGTTQVFWPVVATVTTTIVAFLPLTFIKGNIGDLLGALPIVVACALAMSLIESLMILPSHMAHSLAKRDRAGPRRAGSRIAAIEAKRDALVLDRFIPWYGRFLEGMIRVRYLVAAVALAALILSLGLVGGRRVGFEFLPKTDSETLVIDLRMPIGTPIDQTNAAIEQVERAARAQDETQAVAAVVGSRANIETGENESASAHVAQMFIELKPTEQRDRESSRVIQSMRELLDGRVDQVERIVFSEISGGPGGADINLRVRGERVDELEAAAADIRNLLGRYPGVYDIADDNDVGQLELQIELKPGAAAVGLTRAEVARQVRGALFGIEAHTFAERQEDIDVRVRLDEPTRRSLFAIEHLWLIAPGGRAVPMSEVATIREADAYATIKRVDRQRAITVTAATAPGVSPEDITRDINTRPTEPQPWAPSWLGDLRPTRETGEPAPLDQLRDKHRGVEIIFGGRQEQMADAFATLPIGFLAAVVSIYIILAILFNSVAHPLVVLLVVPFGLIGVIWGHLALGYTVTFLSLIGFVALTGIVVNDSLILVEFYNEQRREGHTVHESLIRAGRARVRAILLTTITTVLGLMPLILERSFQAKFMIPMAIAIAGGLLAASVLILIALPCLMMIFDDVRRVAHFLWHGRWPAAPTPPGTEPPAVVSPAGDPGSS